MLRIFADRTIRNLFVEIAAFILFFSALAAALAACLPAHAALCVLLCGLVMGLVVLALCFRYFRRQDRTMEDAVEHIAEYLSGSHTSRIDCDREGELCRLFHEVNSLAAILNAHAENELQAKRFLKDTISNISHQIKTPLAALNIYNGLLQTEAEDSETVRELTSLSEQELDRIESLVQNLLKITRLDADAVAFEKTPENVAELLRDVGLHFAFRAKREQKELRLSGAEDVSLLCDRGWMQEAVGNLVGNALDHTKAGDVIAVTWRRFPSVVQIRIEDNGSGIRPEDLPHIFKRFYRSRFSTDTPGVGLGLPLAKAIIEAHNGTVEVSSEPGVGTAFVLNFLIPTKL